MLGYVLGTFHSCILNGCFILVNLSTSVLSCFYWILVQNLFQASGYLFASWFILNIKGFGLTNLLVPCKQITLAFLILSGLLS